jgi:hypothetical protein
MDHTVYVIWADISVQNIEIMLLRYLKYEFLEILPQLMCPISLRCTDV